MNRATYTHDDLRNDLGLAIGKIIDGTMDAERATSIALIAEQHHRSVNDDFNHRIKLIESDTFRGREIMAPLFHLESNGENDDDQ